MDLVERVREVIQHSSLTNAEFAVRIGIDPTKLSKSLNGTRRFTSFELASIASQGRTTVDWLLTGDEPERALVAARRWAEPAGAVDEAMRHARHRAFNLAEVVATLDKLAGRRKLAVLPAAVRTGRPLEDAATMADRFLATLKDAGSTDKFRTDPADTVERLFDINVDCERYARGFDGLAVSNSAFRCVIVSTTNSWSRQRFTLVHEIGHIVAGDGDETGTSIDEDLMAAGQPVEEKRANAFAACVLMPHDELLAAVASAGGVNDELFARLVGHFGVSPSALAWRLRNLGIVDDARRAELGATTMRLAAQRGGWTKRLAELTLGQGQTRTPRKLGERAAMAFAEGTVSARVVSTALGTDPETVVAAWQAITESARDDSDSSREAVFQP